MTSFDEVPAVEPRPRPRVSRGRRALLVVLFLLSCIGILTSTVVTWVHQVALNTDRWVAVVGPVASDPEVIAVMSDRISSEVITALQVQQRLEAVLPPKAEFIAAPISQALQEQIQQRLAKAMSTPEFQSAWIAANRVAHEQIVKILRGDSQAIIVEGGYVRLDLWPLVGIALQQLQEAGVIPAGVSLPDLSQGLPAGAGQRLEQALGVTLPADFGTVPLVPADKLLQAQQLVRIFDLLVIVLLLVTILLAAVTVWYAPRRRRMIVYLAIGGAATLLLARFAIKGFEGALVSSFTDADTATTIRAVLDHALGNLFGFTVVVVVLSLVVAVVTYLSGRPAWFVTAAQTAGGATRQVAAGAGAVAASGVSQAPSQETATEWARKHRSVLRLAGLAVIAFVIAWAALGLEIALLTVALVALLEVVLSLLGDSKDAAHDEPIVDDVQAAGVEPTG